MFRFNISEEIILDIKNGRNKIQFLSYNERYVLEKILEKLSKNKVLIIYGKNHLSREKVALDLIHFYFSKNYRECEDMNVYKVNCIQELEDLYLDNRFQIFYLDDFYGKIRFNIIKFIKYLDKIHSKQNKILIVNIRDFLVNRIYELKLNLYCENLDIYKFNFEDNLENFNSHDFLCNAYESMSYIDKFVLFSIFIDNVKDLDMWIKVTRGYFLDKGIFNENVDFNEMILNSYKNLEDKFIYVDSSGKFNIKNVIIRDFLFQEFSKNKGLAKDIFNNIRCYFSFINVVDICKKSNLLFDYTCDEYELYLKQVLHEIVYSDNFKDVIFLLHFVLDVFKIMGITDEEIIKYLNNKIIYLNININDALLYFFTVKHNKQVLIEDSKFKKKILNLLYKYEITREFEFYTYSFKYFLFVSELTNLYEFIDEEDILDIKKNFYRIVNIIFNNINLYFNLHQFSLSKEIKQAIVDLNYLIREFNVQYIFSENIYEFYYNIKFKLTDLFDSVCNLTLENKEDYYVFKYFKNELEGNRDFIESTFDDINIDSVLNYMDGHISKFEL